MAAPRNRKSAYRDRAAPIVKHLRDERMARGVTQEELGYLIGIQASQLSLWERGVKDPGLRSLTNWCDAMGLELAVAARAGA